MNKPLAILYFLTALMVTSAVAQPRYRVPDALLYKPVNRTMIEMQSMPWTAGCDSVFSIKQNKYFYYNSDSVFHGIATRPLEEIYNEVYYYYDLIHYVPHDVNWKREVSIFKTEREKLVKAAKLYKSKTLTYELDLFDARAELLNLNTPENWNWCWSLVKKYDRKNELQTKLRILNYMLYYNGFFTHTVSQRIEEENVPVYKMLNEILSTLERLEGKPNLISGSMYFFIGRLYYDFKFYCKAAPLFWKALEMPVVHYYDRSRMKARDYLASYYRMTGDYNLSDSLYMSILLCADSVFLRPIDETIAMGGLARNAMLQGYDEEALRLYAVALPRALQVKDTLLAGGYAVHLGRLFLQKNELKKTEKMIITAQKYLRADGNTMRNLNIFYTLARDYYLKINRADKAAAYIDSIAEIQSAENNIYNVRSLFYSEREALELEKLLKDEQIHFQKKQIVLISAILALIITTLSIMIYFYSKKQEINRGLYRQIKEQDRLAEDLQQMTLRYNKLEQSVSHYKEITKEQNAEMEAPYENNKQYMLVAKLHEYLLCDKRFTQPDIGYKDLAAELITNKTYLFEAVKTVTGHSLQEYINLIRLEEAKKMLDEKSGSSIEIIAAECGFNTYRTFHRLFKQNYHLSPAEYLRMTKRERG